MLTGQGSGSPAILRKMNVARVLETIRTHGPLTRQGIGVLTGLSKPTVNEAVDLLVGKDLIFLGSPTQKIDNPRPGPRAQQIYYNQFRKMIVGVDVGGSTIRVLLSDLDGNIISSLRGATPIDESRQKILEAIAGLVLQIINENSITKKQIGCVVVGTPGTINFISRKVTIAPQLPDWENFSIPDELNKMLGISIFVENEAHLAVYGENWKGGAVDLSNAAIISIGVGVGLGLMINKNVYRGAEGSAGEIGNLPIAIGDDSSNFELEASATGLEKAFKKFSKDPLAKSIINANKGKNITAKIIYEAATTKNKLAVTLVREQIDLIGRGMAAICCIINPEIFIIMGGLAPSIEKYLPEIQRVIAKFAPYAPKLQITQLEDLSTAIGALRVGIEEVERSAIRKLLSLST